MQTRLLLLTAWGLEWLRLAGKRSQPRVLQRRHEKCAAHRAWIFHSIAAFAFHESLHACLSVSR